MRGVMGVHWRDVPAKEICLGIRKRDFWQGADGAKAQIVEIVAGATFPRLDVHSGAEEIFVVSGVFGDGLVNTKQARSSTIRQAPRTCHSRRKAASSLFSRTAEYPRAQVLRPR